MTFAVGAQLVGSPQASPAAAITGSEPVVVVVTGTVVGGAVVVGGTVVVVGGAVVVGHPWLPRHGFGDRAPPVEATTSPATKSASKTPTQTNLGFIRPLL